MLGGQLNRIIIICQYICNAILLFEQFWGKCIFMNWNDFILQCEKSMLKYWDISFDADKCNKHLKCICFIFVLHPTYIDWRSLIWIKLKDKRCFVAPIFAHLVFIFMWYTHIVINILFKCLKKNMQCSIDTDINVLYLHQFKIYIILYYIVLPIYDIHMRNNGYGYYLRCKRKNYVWKLKMRFVCNCSSSYSLLYVCRKNLIYI